MQPNKEAEGALRSYLGMKAPGYALLIDAPWGAGKTHFVRGVCKVDIERDDVRYVSLNGVADEAAFRRALLQKNLNETTFNIATKLGDIASEHFSLGTLGSLGRDIFEERLISKLPDTLIFDDIERSSLPHKVLFGLINDFIEHQGKRVLLVAHTEVDDQIDEFRKRQEKIVGRSTRIVADFDSAFPRFLVASGIGPGKAFFEEHTDIARSVFDETGHNNLRLLRSAVRDCALLLDRVDNDLFEAKEPMARFVKTYLALAMALARGEISLADLDKRDNWNILSREDEEIEFKGLGQIVSRHPGTDIYAHSGATLSKALAELLFVKGHTDRETLNLLLKTTGQFAPQEENPLWLRMLYWTRCEWDRLQELIDEGASYLFEISPIAPGPYLHIIFSMLWIEKNGGLEIARTAFQKKVLDRIDTLAESGGIPAAQLGVELGWERRGSQFSFGGYVVDGDDCHCELMEAMQRAQLSVFHKQTKIHTDEILVNFQTDLRKFAESMGYDKNSNSYYHLPIFHLIDVNAFAVATIDHLRRGRIEDLGEAFKKIAERQSEPTKWEDERRWFLTLREVLRGLAAGESRLAAAQLEQFFTWSWRFAEAEDRTA